MEGRGLIAELDPSECFELLGSKHVGRVAWCGVNGPQVMPVNYVVVNGSILFRTSPYSGIAKALYEQKAAFQVDEADEFLEAGWSVLVVGTATYLRDPREIPPDERDRPAPWAAGVRTMYIRIDPDPDSVTGRRVFAG